MGRADRLFDGSDAHLLDEELEEGKPCKHHGCLHHVSHPCEGCGRIAGKRQNANTLSGATVGRAGR